MIFSMQTKFSMAYRTCLSIRLSAKALGDYGPLWGGVAEDPTPLAPDKVYVGPNVDSISHCIYIIAHLTLQMHTHSVKLECMQIEVTPTFNPGCNISVLQVKFSSETTGLQPTYFLTGLNMGTLKPMMAI